MANEKAVMTELNAEMQRKTAEAVGESVPKSTSEKKEALDAMTEALRKIEAQTLSGAAVLTPKEVLLDLSDLQAKHPDRHYRWVNIRAPGQADRRRNDGYLRLPESEGGKELGGEIAIFVTTKRVFESRVARIKEQNRLRLEAHRAEVEEVVESVVRELRDKYGMQLDSSRILVDEE